MHTGPRVTWEQNESSSRRDSDETSRAATAYLAWPFAFVELARTAPGSLWYRAHLAQAAVLGVLCTLVVFLMLAFPLFVVIALGGPATGVTIVIYGVALGLDVLVFSAVAWLVIRCAVRASRGDLFSVPLVTRLSERLFRRRET